MLTKSMLSVSCPNRMEYSYIGNCMNRTSFSQDVNSSYVASYGKSLSEFGLGDRCRIEFMYLTSWDVENDGNINDISCTDIRRMMYYGFELSWLNSRCKHGRYAVLDQYNQPHCKYGWYICNCAIYILVSIWMLNFSIIYNHVDLPYPFVRVSATN